MTTTIEWTATTAPDGTAHKGYTFNPWSGCAKISAGCANCYAAALPPKMRRGAEWGLNTDRVMGSASYWEDPFAWARKAKALGVRLKVFCASTADVFEDRPGLDRARARLWGLIRATPELDWLLLTKRPHVMAAWATANGWPTNAWAGTSVEDQRAADERIPYLLTVPALVRFLSMEPLLGPVDIRAWLAPRWSPTAGGCVGGCLDSDSFVHWDWSDRCNRCNHPLSGCPESPLGWVIVGGESGPRARPMHPDWARSIRDQCAAAGVPFFFKQWGGADKKAAGRLLDGALHDSFPTPLP